MNFQALHPWDVDVQTARTIQIELQKRIILEKHEGEFRVVAGADVSYSKTDDNIFAAVVVSTFSELTELETGSAVGRVSFPYIPGLLSFREGPILLEAFRKLKTKPDVVLFDGQGIAHPLGLGLATHIGLILDVPTIGCAKSKLVGVYEEVGENPGNYSPLRFKGQVVGVALRTRKGVKPMIVSPGHKINLDQTIEVVMRTVRGYRLPEPTRRAHILVNKLRQEYKIKRLV